jgi:hypothetical protein
VPSRLATRSAGGPAKSGTPRPGCWPALNLSRRSSGIWYTRATRQGGFATSPHTPPSTPSNLTGLHCSGYWLCPAIYVSTYPAMAQTTPSTRQSGSRWLPVWLPASRTPNTYVLSGTRRSAASSDTGLHRATPQAPQQFTKERLLAGSRPASELSGDKISLADDLRPEQDSNLRPTA